MERLGGAQNIGIVSKLTPGNANYSGMYTREAEAHQALFIVVFKSIEN